MKSLKFVAVMLEIIMCFNFFGNTLCVVYAYDENAVKVEETNVAEEVNVIEEKKDETEDTTLDEDETEEANLEETKALDFTYSINNNAMVPTTFSNARTVVGNATVSLRRPDNMYYATVVSQIDVATLNEDGYKLAFQVGIDMQGYYNEYIKPLIDSGWSSNASQFTVTFPTEMFDSNLEIDWSAVEGPKSGPLKLQKANATDGVVLCGNSSLNLTDPFYFSGNFIYVRVPAKLANDKYDLSSEKQSIDLDGTVTAKVADASLSDLEFTASYSIPVINSEKGLLQVTSSDGSDVLFENGSWQLSDGTYDVSGNAQDFEGITISGNATINLNDATILHKTIMLEKYAPAISVISGNANIVLNGENTVEGSSGYAGIYVAPGASLTISGSGVLNAKGGEGLQSYNLPTNLQIGSSKRGYVGGGAGIGGNGLLVDANDDLPILGLVNCFGDITIDGGTVNAIGGGIPDYTNNGAGAGIGAGGTSSSSGMDNIASGNVYINGGTVNATGGNGQPNSLTGGGAGIGTGGVTGNNWAPYRNNVKVSISGGIVNATGTADGAGIGGGCNTDSGVIEITGGTITSIGGYEIENGAQYWAFGGAGIGGGDMGGVTSITITGGTVYAKAIGAASGIGSGNDGFVGIIDYADNSVDYGDIHIGGNADVTAIGGKHPDGTLGGAGIGAGQSYYNDNGFGSISITDEAKVRAYAGPLAQAVGVGSNYAGTDPNQFKVGSEKVDVWLFNQDTAQGAFWGQDDTGDDLTEDYSSEGATAIWYTMPDGETFPSENTSTKAYMDGNDELSWEYDASKNIKILRDGKVIREEYCGEGTIGNWATFTNVPTATTYKVVYYDVAGNAIKTTETRDAMSGDTVTITDDDKTIKGYTFDEDNANNCLEAIVAKDGTTVLKLYFTKNLTPVNPINPTDPINPNSPTKIETATEIINSGDNLYINPKTGDNLGRYNILFMVSVLGLLGLLVLNRNKREVKKIN